MRIGLTFDLRPAGRPTDAWDEWDEPQTIVTIERALRALGHEVVRIGSAREFLRRLPQLRHTLDLIFNLAEGHTSRTREAWVPTLCALADLPCVGSSPQALTLALDKWVTKRLWRAEGLPVPWGVSVARHEDLALVTDWPFPLIVKPRHEGSGMGIDDAAIVADGASLRSRVAWVIATYHEPALVEQFIRGGEVTVCLLGHPLKLLGVIQRHVDPATTLSCHILQKGRPDADNTWALPLAMTAALEQRCAALALRASQALGCRDLARVDLRVDAREQPWLLEINPLPSLASDSSMALLAEAMGRSFPDLCHDILPNHK